MKRRFLLLVFYYLFYLGSIFSQSQGENLFKQNEPKNAVKVLENEILNGIISENTYNFLGLGYYQIGEYSKSIEAFERGKKAQPTLVALLSYNQGNTYYAMKDYSSAISSYSQVLKEDPTYYEALLNRANALLMSSQLKIAKDGYVEYIQKCPNDKQRAQIEKLINALEKEIVRREERERLLAEEEKAKWEQYDEPFEENDTKSGNFEETKTNWEKIYLEKDEYQSLDNKLSDENVIDDNELNNWQSIDKDEKEEIQRLDEMSREEHEKWVAEQNRILKEKEQEKNRKESEEKLKNYVEKEKEEQELRQKIMDEMIKAENERKQKLLEDITHSLMNGESTNMSSGADDILDYNLEGELE